MNPTRKEAPVMAAGGMVFTELTQARRRNARDRSKQQIRLHSAAILS
jgi:hypothetical protein